MILARKILFPFAILYKIITSIRNFLFEKGVLKSTSFDIPIIVVGNLSAGGTGKTPQIEYLIRLLSNDYQLATLSRGYKRQSEGFILAGETSNAVILGDEPFQFFQKFKNIQVAVDKNRTNGIRQLLSQHKKPEVILLDDAFQHRKVKAGFYILLTSYGDLYVDDWMLPTGNLRESKNAAKRADVVIVTKCPTNLEESEQENIRRKLKSETYQQVYFTYIEYDNYIYSQKEKLAVAEIRGEQKLLLAGIANPTPFFNFLKSEDDECLIFPDHHHFTEADIRTIAKKAKKYKIITTEKDYVRLKDTNIVSQLYYLPIKSSFINHQNNFDTTIFNYVGKSSGNS